jgi:hypothetical protein
MIKKVTNCINCPLCYVDQTSNDSVDAFCSFASKGLTEKEVKLTLNAGDHGIFIPEWCPLKQSDYTISLSDSIFN